MRILIIHGKKGIFFEEEELLPLYLVALGGLAVFFTNKQMRKFTLNLLQIYLKSKADVSSKDA